MEFDLIAEEKGVTSDELWKAMVAGKVPREAIFLGRSIVEKADLSEPTPEVSGRGGRGEGRERERGSESDPRGNR